MSACLCPKCHCGCMCYDCAAKACHKHCTELEGTCSWKLSLPWTFKLRRKPTKRYSLRSEVISRELTYLDDTFYADLKCCEELYFCLRARSFVPGLLKRAKCVLTVKTPTRCTDDFAWGQEHCDYHGHTQVISSNGQTDEKEQTFEILNYRLGTFVPLPLRLHKPFDCTCQETVMIIVRHAFRVGLVTLVCSIKGGTRMPPRFLR
jgi:hypothetical protein